MITLARLVQMLETAGFCQLKLCKKSILLSSLYSTAVTLAPTLPKGINWQLITYSGFIQRAISDSEQSLLFLYLKNNFPTGMACLQILSSFPAYSTKHVANRLQDAVTLVAHVMQSLQVCA